MWSDFKEFISRGSVMDLAVGVIIGAAFGKIVTSLVDDMISPIIGKLLADVDLTAMRVVLGTKQEGDKVVEAAIKYGSFIQSLINFLIIAFVIFLIVKAYNKVRRTTPVSQPTPTEALLAEIRDLLKR